MKKTDSDEVVTLHVNVQTLVALLERTGLLKLFAERIGLQDMPKDATLLTARVDESDLAGSTHVRLSFQSAEFKSVEQKMIFWKSWIAEEDIARARADVVILSTARAPD